MLPIVSIEGRVVAEPELRFSASGMAVTRLRLVASKRKKDEQSGEWVDDKTLWIDATCFKQLAENVAESIKQGDIVIATGQLQTDEWEDRESGQKRSKITLTANAVAASLQFRTISHGAGRAERSSGGSSAEPDPFASGQAQPDEPPF